jgi:acetyltransferase-like isoleucine patch superfamily enzyme
MLAVGICGVAPFSGVRVFLYRHVLGYKIGKGTRINWLTFIDGKKVDIGREVHFRGIKNYFVNIGTLKVGDRSAFGSPRLGHTIAVGYGDSKFIVGRGTRITLKHFFDLTGDIEIGDHTVIGGMHSQFFTHSFHRERPEAVKIGSGCYIGSNVLFAQGAEIPDRTVVAMGSAIAKKFEKPDTLIGGVPAKVLREKYGYDAKMMYNLKNRPW